jgi:hypothetical protein
MQLIQAALRLRFICTKKNIAKWLACFVGQELKIAPAIASDG